MMTTTGDGSSREELTTELATLDRQLRDLSNQWENVERTITEKVRLRRELIARQTESNEDHAGEIDRLQSDIYALRDRLDQLRDSHLDFSALYRILQQGRT
jgi:predicted RNase H-like nuclease (RuvC/YqgF family)